MLRLVIYSLTIKNSLSILNIKIISMICSHFHVIFNYHIDYTILNIYLPLLLPKTALSLHLNKGKSFHYNPDYSHFLTDNSFLLLFPVFQHFKQILFPYLANYEFIFYSRNNDPAFLVCNHFHRKMIPIYSRWCLRRYSSRLVYLNLVYKSKITSMTHVCPINSSLFRCFLFHFFF